MPIRRRKMVVSVDDGGEGGDDGGDENDTVEDGTTRGGFQQQQPSDDYEEDNRVVRLHRVHGDRTDDDDGSITSKISTTRTTKETAQDDHNDGGFTTAAASLAELKHIDDDDDDDDDKNKQEVMDDDHEVMNDQQVVTDGGGLDAAGTGGMLLLSSSMDTSCSSSAAADNNTLLMITSSDSTSQITIDHHHHHQQSAVNGKTATNGADYYDPASASTSTTSTSSSNSSEEDSSLPITPDDFVPATTARKSSKNGGDVGETDNSAASNGAVHQQQKLFQPPVMAMVNGGDYNKSSVTGTITTTSSNNSSEAAAAMFVQQLAVRLAAALNRMWKPLPTTIRTNDDEDAEGGNNNDRGGEAGIDDTTMAMMMPKPDPVVAHVLLRWLRAFEDTTRSPSPSMSTVSCPEYVELQDKLHRLETDRESLSLQVSVLSEQVGAQSDKIKDLESLLDDKRRKLDSAEELLHGELSTRSGLETDRLDLLSEISQLKLKLASLERDKISTEHRLRGAKGEIHSLQRVMQERYSELVTAHQQQQQTSGRPSHHNHQQQSSNANNYPAAGGTGAEKGRQGPTVDPAGEIEQLRSTVQHLMSVNAEKEQRIEQMRLLMERQLMRNTSAGTMNGHGMVGRIADSSSDVSSTAVAAGGIPYAHRSGSLGSGAMMMMGTSSLSNSSSAHTLHHHQHQQRGAPPVDINQQLRQLLLAENDIPAPVSSLPSSASYPETFLHTGSSRAAPPPGYPSVYLHGMGAGAGSGASMMQPSASYTANLSSTTSASSNVVRDVSGGAGAAGGMGVNWSAPVTPHHQQAVGSATTGATPPPAAQASTAAARQLAAELSELVPQYRRQSPLGFYHTGSLPRGVGQGPSPNKKKSSVDAGVVNASGEWRSSSRQPKRAAGVGGLKWLLNLKATSKRSTSAPNLVDSDEEGVSPTSRPGGGEKLKREKKQNSLRTLISRLKRSNSQEFGNGDLGNGGDFRRGGFVRSTAGPRLRSWSREPAHHAQRSMPIRPSVEQFGKWTSEEVSDWLNEIGLTMYVADCRRNIRSGRHMMSLTPLDMERDLAIRNQLHKKKLIIALRNIELGKPEPSDQLDYQQVLRWLDDVGLPQYRDAFAEHRVDGALLNLLTVEDLLQMRIGSAIHHATIARGIQILRMIGFNLNRFIRKFNPDIVAKSPLPNQVQLWSQHCVTEWLRSIDLTEFTPNLMCAGIHGALIALEPTFTAESLAAVLQIPTQKTLIRRHLTTHFNQLLGQDIIASKREALAVPFAVQLVPGLKVKAVKKGFTLSRRKHNRTEVYMEPDDLVCPLTPNRKPPSSAALLDRLPESISESMLSSLSSSNV